VASDERVPVRAYGRRVFQVERRLYRVERWRLPVPGGIPLRAAAYAVATFLLVLVASRLPGLGALVGLAHPAYPYVLLPLAVGVLGSQVAPDGRATHRFARDWVAFALRARRRSAGRVLALEGEPLPGAVELALRADHRARELRPGVVHGPATVVFREPVALAGGRRGRWRARPAGERSPARGETRVEQVVLEPGERLEVRAG
jgi:hypothetical protein